MSELVIMQPTEAIMTATTADLRRELAQALEVTAAHLGRVAMIWRELERRGEDLSALRGGLWAYMPLIASGRLRAELVVKYAGHSTLLRRLADLRPEDQGRILTDDTVPVVEYVDGEWVERVERLTHLKTTMLQQVISDRIRTPDEQRKAARSRASRPTAKAARGSLPPTRGLEVVEELATQRAPRGGTNRQLQVAVTMSEEEIAALDRHCETMGVSRSRAVRAALEAMGLLTP
ncbi:ribbon-helix-helix protein, CopG family [Roseococcus pinisoli]|uniref:Ribbon-helix-helix protein, CopG family n=1 Tax=Roseococcus pinisoli TaxID=2835040 RepID=A0ABS5QAL6_9PROT|nr:ribbon-helix-helix protein, CopG family [Roseococcus pinisoli]MBS7810553.1 ribbon-helix-helix protein, CopG family [Roseococcus pinisoli]